MANLFTFVRKRVHFLPFHAEGVAATEAIARIVIATFEPNGRLVRLFFFGACHLRCMEYCNGSSKDQSRPFASVWIGMVFPFDFHANMCNIYSRMVGIFAPPT